MSGTRPLRAAVPLGGPNTPAKPCQRLWDRISGQTGTVRDDPTTHRQPEPAAT